MDLLNLNAVVRLHSGALIAMESELAGWKLRKDHASGNIVLGYYNRHYGTLAPNWDEVSVYTFEDTLVFKEIRHAYDQRSPQAYFRGTSQEYLFLYDELKNMIPHMVNGTITGKFTFRKQGKVVSNVFVKE